MTLAVETKTLRKSLLGGVSVMAFTLALGMSSTAYASSGHPTAALTYTPNGTMVTVTDLDGLTSVDPSDHAITIDSGLGEITLGIAGSREAITFGTGGGTFTATYTLTESKASNNIIFDGDILAEGDASIILNATTADTYFNGNVNVGTGTATLTLGRGIGEAADTYFNASGSSDTVIDMTINAASAADFSSVIIQNPDGNAGEKITFRQAIGGGSIATALDVLALSTDTDVIFESTVRANNIVMASALTTTFKGAVTGDIKVEIDGTVVLGDGVAVTGYVDNVTGADGTGTLTIEAQTTGPITAVSGDVGATNSLKAVNVDSSGNDVIFDGAVDAQTVTITGAGGVTFNGDVTGDLNLAGDAGVLMGADISINGNVDTSVASQGSLYFSPTESDTTLVSGTIGAINALKFVDVIASDGTTATFGGAVKAVNIRLSGSGNVEFLDAVTGNISSGAGTVTFNYAVNGDIALADAGTVVLRDGAAVTGNVDNITGINGKGTLTIEAQTTGPITAVSGDVGAKISLKAVNVTSTANTVTFGGAVNATTITLTGATDTDETVFQGDVTGAIVIDTAGLVTFAADTKVVGSVTTNTDGQGLLTFATATTDTMLVSGAVGTSGGNALKRLTVDTGAGITSTFGGTVNAEFLALSGSGNIEFLDAVTGDIGLYDGTVTFRGTVNGDVALADAGTVVLRDGAAVAGNVDNITGINGTGTLNVEAQTNGPITAVSGDIGANSSLKVLNVNSDGEEITFGGNVFADRINIGSDGIVVFQGDVTGNVELTGGGTISMAAGAVIDGDVDNTSGADNSGKLIIGALAGGGTVVTGAVGATKSLSQVTIDTSGGMLTFDGSVNTVNFTASGGDFTLFSSSAIITNLTSDNDVYTNGTLDVNGSINITGGGLYISGGATLGGASIAADQIALYSDVTFDGIEAQTVTGLVDANNNNDMTLTNTQGVTFESEIGKYAAIGALNIGSGAAATFESTVSASVISIGNSSLATFNGAVTSDVELMSEGTVVLGNGGSITGNIVNMNDGPWGTLTVESQTKGPITAVSGNIGDGFGLNVLNVDSSGEVVTFGGDVFAQTANITGTGTVAFDGDVTGNVNLTSGGTISMAAGAVIDGDVDNVSGADNSGTLTIGAIGADLAVVTGTVGAPNSLAQVTVDTTGGVATFAGAVNTTAFTATGTGTTVLAGGGTITTLTASNDVTSGNSGTGALDVNGNIVITGGDLIILGGATLGGASIIVDKMTSNSGLTFDGTEAQTVSGLVDNDAFWGGGFVTLTNTKGVTFESAIGSTTALEKLIIGSTYSGRFNKTVKAYSLDLDGTIQIEDTVTIMGNLDIGDGAKIILGGGIVATETAFTIGDVVSAGTTTIEVSPTFTAGTITLFDSAADASGDLANLTITDTALTDYTLVVNGNDIEITAVAKTAEETEDELDISSQESVAIRNARLAIATNNDKLLVNFAAALNAGGAVATKAAETVAVQAETLSAGSNTAVSVGGKVVAISYNRLSSLRSGSQHQSSAETGFATGDVSSSTGVWFKPFGNWAAQDNTNGVAGFDSTTYGAAFGADTEVDDNIRLGGTFAYATTSVDGSGAGQATSEIDSYQMTVYGDYTTDDYFIEGSLGYAYNQNDVSRVIDLSGTPTVANGEYNSSQFMASFNAGVPLNIDGATYFTPTAGLSWTHVASTSYTETGAGGLNQSVDIDAVDVLIGSLGGKFHTQIQSSGGHFVPEIHGGINYDVIGDNATATATFTGGGAAFTVEGADVEQFGGNMGFGLTYESNNAWSLGMRYDADMKASYISHSALIEARFKF